MSIIKKIANRLYWGLTVGIRYPFNNVIIKGDRNCDLQIGRNVYISNCTINLHKGASLSIEDNVILKNITINLNGKAFIGKKTKLYSSDRDKRNYVDINGNLFIGKNNRLETNIRVRFGGQLTIGNYTNINTDSEIRCDDSISIGSYNQISYNVMIWDTNTHNIYGAEKRRNITKENGIGFEYEKPKTAPIFIGDDCWIGKNCSLLKGTKISDKCIIGYQTVLSNITVEQNSTITTDIKYKIFKNSI